MSTGDSTPASTDVRRLTSDVISAALGEISLSAIDQSRPLGEAVQYLSVCGSRVSVQLALQVSGALELLAIDTVVADSAGAGTPAREPGFPALRRGRERSAPRGGIVLHSEEPDRPPLLGGGPATLVTASTAARSHGARGPIRSRCTLPTRVR